MTERGKIIPLVGRQRKPCFFLRIEDGVANCDYRAMQSDATGQPVSSLPRPSHAGRPMIAGVGSDVCNVADSIKNQQGCDSYEPQP